MQYWIILFATSFTIQMIRIRCQQLSYWSVFFATDLTILIIQIIICKKELSHLDGPPSQQAGPTLGWFAILRFFFTLRCFLRRWQTVCPRLTTSIPPCLCTTPTVSVEVQISTKLCTCCEENKKTKIPRWDDEPPHPPHPPPTPPTSPSRASYGNVGRWYRSFPLKIIGYKFISPIFFHMNVTCYMFCYIITFALLVFPS